MKAWGGRFTEGPDPVAAEFGRSIEVDRELALDDLTGALARCDVVGGTAPARVAAELAAHEARLGAGAAAGW